MFPRSSILSLPRYALLVRVSCTFRLVRSSSLPHANCQTKFEKKHKKSMTDTRQCGAERRRERIKMGTANRGQTAKGHILILILIIFMQWECMQQWKRRSFRERESNWKSYQMTIEYDQRQFNEIHSKMQSK